MDADLMGPARLQLQGKDGHGGKAMQHPIVGHSPATVRDHRHALAVRRMAADGRVHRPFLLFDVPRHQGDIAPVRGMVGELFGQLLVRQVVLRHHQQAAGHLIDTMDDAGPDLPADGG